MHVSIPSLREDAVFSLYTTGSRLGSSEQSSCVEISSNKSVDVRVQDGQLDGKEG